MQTGGQQLRITVTRFIIAADPLPTHRRPPIHRITTGSQLTTRAQGRYRQELIRQKRARTPRTAHPIKIAVTCNGGVCPWRPVFPPASLPLRHPVQRARMSFGAALAPSRPTSRTGSNLAFARVPAMTTRTCCIPCIPDLAKPATNAASDHAPCRCRCASFSAFPHSKMVLPKNAPWPCKFVQNGQSCTSSPLFRQAIYSKATTFLANHHLKNKLFITFILLRALTSGLSRRRNRLDKRVSANLRELVPATSTEVCAGKMHGKKTSGFAGHNFCAVHCSQIARRQ